MKTRAYVVEEGDETRLVNGISIAQVLRHVTADRISIRVAKQADFIAAMESGLQMEYAEKSIPGKDEEESE